MKKFKLFTMVILISCTLISNDARQLLSKIRNHEIINKKELEKSLSRSLGSYNNKFIGTGNILKTGNISAAIVQGKKNDKIYDILLVFEGDNFIRYEEQVHCTYYLKDSSVIREKMLGRIYLDYPQYDTTCIRASFEKIYPIKIDTLRYKFRFDMARIKSKDSLIFCLDKR